MKILRKFFSKIFEKKLKNFLKKKFSGFSLLRQFLVRFRDLVGVGIAPVSKKTAVKYISLFLFKLLSNFARLKSKLCNLDFC